MSPQMSKTIQFLHIYIEQIIKQFLYFIDGLKLIIIRTLTIYFILNIYLLIVQSSNCLFSIQYVQQ